MPLPARFAGLQIAGADDLNSTLGTTSSTNCDNSFNLSDTLTLQHAPTQVKLCGAKGLELPDGTAMSSTQLDDVEKQRVLGQGASSRVYLCRHRRTGELLALKELTAMASSDARHQALNEIALAQRHETRSEHLIRFIDAYFDQGNVCILMELADAGTLADAISQSGGVPERVMRSVMLQLLRGLYHLHHVLRQVHRDIKPANCMLFRAGLAKLSDFGVSRQLDSTLALAQTQVGTQAYMSPERLHGEAYDGKADVWCCGLLVVEALSGAPPFAGARTFIEQVHAITSGALPTPPDGTSPEAKAFVAACLRRESSARPGSAALLAATWMGAAEGDGRDDVASWLRLLELWAPSSVGEPCSRRASRVESRGPESPVAPSVSSDRCR